MKEAGNAKRLLITGSSKGIGRFLAEHCCEANWEVLGCSRGEVEWTHPKYTHYTCDISQEKGVLSLFRQIKRNHHNIDGVICNAGTAAMNHLLLTPDSSLKSVFETNVFGTFYVLREAAKLMRGQRSGRIILFSSIAAALNLEGEAVYAASKAALESLTRTAAKELAPYHITVNAVGPTPVNTDLIKTIPQETVDSLIRQQAIQRMGTFEDIANVTDFFLSPKSDFVTGQVLYLGGVS